MAIMWHNSFIFGPNFNNHHHQMEKEILAGCLEQPVVAAVQSQFILIRHCKINSTRFGTVWYGAGLTPAAVSLKPCI